MKIKDLIAELSKLDGEKTIGVNDRGRDRTIALSVFDGKTADCIIGDLEVKPGNYDYVID